MHFRSCENYGALIGSICLRGKMCLLLIKFLSDEKKAAANLKARPSTIDGTQAEVEKE